MRPVQSGKGKRLDGSFWLCGGLSAKAEARMLFSLIGRNGDTLETVRELIAVPPETEALLRQFAEEWPECARGVEAILRYRRKVGEEFERLVERLGHVEVRVA